MNNANTSPFSIQAKPLFRYERNGGQIQQGKKMDTTTVLTGTGSFGGFLMKAKDSRNPSRFA